MKQCEIVAIVKDRKAAGEKAITSTYQQFQKTDLFNGLTRVYTPKEENGEKFPTEKKPVSLTVGGLLESLRTPFINLFDTVLTQDIGNLTAKGNVKVTDGGHIFELAAVPATHLLFLEKKLDDLHTMVSAMPTLDIADSWRADASSGLFKSDPTESNKTRASETPLVLAPATEKHPAQVKTVPITIVDGVWTATKISGAVSPITKKAILERIRLLKEAVVIAREEANAVSIEPQTEGKKIFDFIFGA